MSIVMGGTVRRIRRTPDAVREEALTVARRLLLTGGPASLTLKAVAAELGMTHANLIHHFGSAGGLQSALVERMIADMADQVRGAIRDLRAGIVAPRAVVDLVFALFEDQGAGRLLSWMMLSGEAERLRTFCNALHDLIVAIEADAPQEDKDVHQRVTTGALVLVLAAVGDSLIGPVLHAAVEREPTAVRDAVADVIDRLRVPPSQPQ